MRKIFLLTYLISIVFFYYCQFIFAQDDSLWIEPGVGIGKLRLGDSYKGVISKLGFPENKKGTPGLGWLEYSKLYIEVSRVESIERALYKLQQTGEKISPEEIESTVQFITVYDSLTKTRGNLSIGSTLKEVIQVFGDTQVHQVSQTPLKIVKCADVNVFKIPENRPSMLKEDGFSGYVLTVSYNNEGIDFHFRIENNSLKVFAITVSKKQECKKYP